MTGDNRTGLATVSGTVLPYVTHYGSYGSADSDNNSDNIRRNVVLQHEHNLPYLPAINTGAL
jgi:hypothetical protein